MKLKYYKRSAVIFASWIIPPKAEDIEDIHGIPIAQHIDIGPYYHEIQETCICFLIDFIKQICILIFWEMKYVLQNFLKYQVGIWSVFGG